MKRETSRRPFRLPFFLLLSLCLVLSLACGDGDKPSPSGEGPASSGEGDNRTATPPPAGTGGGDEGDPAEGGEEDVSGTLRPGEKRRLEEALEGLKNSLLYGDPDGFIQGYMSVGDLQSVIEATKGKDAWKERLEEAGGDALEFEKVYRNRLMALYEDLREPGGRCGLSAEAFQAIRSAAKPSRFLFADTFLNPLGRNFIVILGGLSGPEGLRGLIRLRSIPHRNRRKWYLHGDEKIESLPALERREAERIAGALAALQRAQEAFRKSCAVDRDGDGKGEYAFLTELAGLVAARGSEATHVAEGLPEAFLEVSVSGKVLYKTHLITLYLPWKGGYAVEDHPGVLEPSEVTDARETLWYAFAWPVARGCGHGLYFAGPSGPVLKRQGDSPFHGPGKAPAPRAAGRPGGAPQWVRPLEGAGSSTTGVAWVAVE